CRPRSLYKWVLVNDLEAAVRRSARLAGSSAGLQPVEELLGFRPGQPTDGSWIGPRRNALAVEDEGLAASLEPRNGRPPGRGDEHGRRGSGQVMVAADDHSTQEEDCGNGQKSRARAHRSSHARFE